ncbi:MAG: hypothetical protein U5K30_11540 [Acidimicrobiales bacterium]|nr:hypothetical protein [Acidimicrobiales bacterium]
MTPPAALPGVGIAVALVPPLAAVGITLEAGAAGSRSRQRCCCIVTNLAAIVFAGAVALLLGGLTPDDPSSSRRLRVSFAITVGAVLAVAVPLGYHSAEVIADTRFERAVADAVREWDDSIEVLELTTDVDDGRGTVELRVAATRSESAGLATRGPHRRPSRR